MTISHSLRGSVDWNNIWHGSVVFIYCHSLRGSVDWNQYIYQLYLNFLGHSLRGSVDWNVWTIRCNSRLHMSLPSWECGLKSPWLQKHKTTCPVTPFVGVWIEIPNSIYPFLRCESHSLRGSVDWNWYCYCNMGYVTWSLPSWECGLKYLWIVT